MEGSSNPLLLSASSRIQDYEYLYASNTNVSNFVSVKLSGNGNYILWKAQMLCLLDSIGMRGIVDATFVGLGDSGTDTMRRYDNLVKGWIFGSVSEDVLVDIYNLDSAKAVWEKIKSIYEPAICLHEDSTRKESNTKIEIEDIDVVSKETNTIEGGDSIEVSIVGKNIVPAETEEKNEDTPNKTKPMTYLDEILQFYNNFREASRHGDWFRINERLLNEAIRNDGSTVLHVVVGMGRNDILKEFLNFATQKEVHKKRDFDGSTALHVAAIVGNTHAAELLVKNNKQLLQIVDHNGKDPLRIAYENMHLDTIVYLLKAMKESKAKLQSSSEGSSHPGMEIVVDVLINAISAKQYGLAIELMQKFPSSASQSDDVLMAIASTFPSGLEDWEKLIYPSFTIFVGKIRMVASLIAIECCMVPNMLYDIRANPERKSTLPVVTLLLIVVLLIVFMIIVACTFIYLLILLASSPFHVLYVLMWKCAMILVGPIKHIEKKIKEWDGAEEVLKLVCDEIDKLIDYNGTHHPYYTQPILKAACRNAYKVLDEILSRSPNAIQSRDKNGYDIIQLAVINRCEKSYNIIYDIGERKNLYRTMVDSSGNNILHLVGRLAPSYVLNQRTGAALQLQRELQWREEVKKHVFPTYITKENILMETPDMIFTREHKDLVKDGEKWMKTTAQSCSVTAALITTIVFAAAITVPGGSSQDKGTPLFKKEGAFIIFAISNAVSLFTSTTALLVFLSILTTRFAENDFLISLPRRLVIGVFSLLLSTIAMMVAFSSTVFLVFCDKKLWMLAPICGSAFIPIACFVILQFPLIMDLFTSTYFPIFGEKRARILKGYNQIDMRSIFRK